MRRLIGPTHLALSFSLIVLALGLTPSRAMASGFLDDIVNNNAGFCSSTADALFRACGNDVEDNYWLSIANCINLSDSDERAQCRADARSAVDDGDQLCRDQMSGRLDACKALGEGRYDPDINPAQFDADFAHLTHPNRYFPLKIGNVWVYKSGTEVDRMEILNRTKLIDGVRCIVSRDLVTDDGEQVEATDDWIAQAKDGTVWYFGEEAKVYENFPDDHPSKPELVSIDGSFKAGRESDKPGILFLASAKKGQTYLEESSLGNAEDMSEILSTTYAFGKDKDLDHLVPPQLAKLLCAGDCVVTRNVSLLEPGGFERKYYAPGIGDFLEIESTGVVSQLTSCNFDPRCAKLPRSLSE